MIVKGLVQGVGFRYYAHRQASSLGLTGFAANMYDGTVELEVEGNRSAIEEFITMVKVGPRSAHVANLTIEWKEFQSRYSHFEVR